jgi:hypothetical protein
MLNIQNIAFNENNLLYSVHKNISLRTKYDYWLLYLHVTL